MLTIVLPPEVADVVTERARMEGTTPELLAIAKLREQFLPEIEPASTAEQGSMADFFADFIGSINSSAVAPGGSTLSEDVEETVNELLRKKRHQGKL